MDRFWIYVAIHYCDNFKLRFVLETVIWCKILNQLERCEECEKGEKFMSLEERVGGENFFLNHFNKDKSENIYG